MIQAIQTTYSRSTQQAHSSQRESPASFAAVLSGAASARGNQRSHTKQVWKNLPAILGLSRDQAFAKKILQFEGEQVRTDKTIKWDADGTHTLTPDEIESLKANYDVTHLTPQDFYDLMADLTNLNAISAGEAIYIYRGISAPSLPLGEGTYFEFENCLQNYSWNPRFTSMESWSSEGNYMEMLLGAQEHYRQKLEEVKSPEFYQRSLNRILHVQDSDSFLNDFIICSERDYQQASRLVDIFSQLVRDPEYLETVDLEKVLTPPWYREGAPKAPPEESMVRPEDIALALSQPQIQQLDSDAYDELFRARNEAAQKARPAHSTTA